MYNINVLVKGQPVEKYINPQVKSEKWIEGRDGSEYQLQLVNNSNADAEFVVSVDGLDIITGKPAGSDSKGYIVKANSKSIIDGWLVDEKTAAKFKFSKQENSYSNKSGQGIDNTGVIGLQVFTKKYVAYTNTDWPWNNYQYPYDYDYNKRYFTYPFISYSTCESIGSKAIPGIQLSASLGNLTNSNIVSATATPLFNAMYISVPEVETKLGTEFGEATEFKTNTVNFERASNIPYLKEVLYYGDVKKLNALGIVPTWQKKTSVKRPDPFPRDSTYCEPPKGWTVK